MQYIKMNGSKSVQQYNQDNNLLFNFGITYVNIDDKYNKNLIDSLLMDKKFLQDSINDKNIIIDNLKEELEILKNKINEIINKDFYNEENIS